MHVIILGAAAGGGFPQWNCACSNCDRARRGDPAAGPRGQSGVAVSADGECWFLLNASPDLRAQIGRERCLQPRLGSGRASPVAGVVLTGADVDFVAGLLDLRESQPLALHATARVLAQLAASPIFNVLDPRFVTRHELPLDREVSLLCPDGCPSGLVVEAFAVPGKVALYAEDGAAAPELGTLAGDAVGLRVGAGDRSFFYIPACAGMTASLAGRLRGADLVLFDGTLWHDEEMIALGLGTKTGARMGHLSVSGPGGTIALLAPLGIGRKIFVHINNTNPMILNDSPERAAAVRAGWEVAEDGMEITL